MTEVLMKRVIIDRSDILTYPYGVKDKAGRSMGCNVELVKAEMIVAPVGSTAPFVGTEADLGLRYGYRLHTTRNGAGFGPTPDWRWFKRRDERAAAVLKHVHNSKTRAMAFMRGRNHDADPDT